MEIQEESRYGVTVIGLRGRLDAQTCPAAEPRLVDLTNQSGQTLVLDFSEVSFVSSGGLALLLKVAKNVRETNGKLALAALSNYVHEVFEIAGFTSMFSIFPTCEDAVAHLKGDRQREDEGSIPPGGSVGS